jgi:hypothetical protein
LSRYLLVSAGKTTLNRYIPETVRKCLALRPGWDTGVNQLALFT